MHVSYLSQHLANRGHRILPLCTPGSPLDNDFKKRGFAPHHFSLGGYFHPRAILKLLQLLRTERVEIVHAHYSRDLWTIVPALARRDLSRIALVLTKHIGTQKPKRDLLHRLIYRRVNYLIAISEVIRANLLATHPVAAEKVGVVHHGVDLEEFSPERHNREVVRAELGWPDELVFGIVGRLQISKGYLEFLEMARRIRQAVPRARFLLIGEASRGEEAEARHILQKIDALDLHSVTQWLGFRKDVARLLSAMDIFVFPSHAEAFGLVLIEAMAMGKAVISSNCDGVLDIVKHGETGLLVPPKEIEALTQAGLALAENPALRNKLAWAGRQHVRAAFSLPGMLANIELIYNKLTHTNGMIMAGAVQAAENASRECAPEAPCQ